MPDSNARACVGHGDLLAHADRAYSFVRNINLGWNKETQPRRIFLS